ncbi:Tag1p Ecym_2726 [Eremothecium cymbalariae DBVPG|uniref:Uncharacterized protein n=1 Tax=Eremothecium cymbalariae (strain CBS 270.75 / DBVPG 7215 / KCTC 17166 / NRRL Y-17582) TaxID=931890 RepID=G8JPG1_ERECY|nr:Hypothetical protein Ecym_2726 [Eremothecium cymbalariae DBVPG\
MADTEDESRPLLSSHSNDYLTTEAYETGMLRNIRSKGRSRTRLLLITTFLLVFVLIPFCYVYGNAPEQEQLQQYISDIAEFKLNKVQFKGWKDIDHSEASSPTYPTEDLKKWMVFDVNLSFSVDYDGSSTALLTDEQRKIVKVISGNVLRRVCFRINSVETFAEDDNIDKMALFTMLGLENLCVSLLDKKVTDINTVISVKPNIKNLSKIFWLIKNNDKLNTSIWSSLDLNIGEHIFWDKYLMLNHFSIPKISLDRYIHWNKIRSTLRHLSTIIQELSSNSKITNFKVQDSNEHPGFIINGEISVPPPKEIPKWLYTMEGINIPSTQWSFKLPNCNSDNTIEVNGASIQTNCVSLSNWFSEDAANVSATITVPGPLSDELLYHLCSYENDDIVTPMSILVRKLFNSTELIFFDVHGQKALVSDNCNTLPIDLATELVQSIDSPVVANFTIKQEDIIEEATIEKLELEVSNDYLGEFKLSVTGIVVLTLNPPFYELNDQSKLSIDKIKGVTKFYHNDIHFITTPILKWTVCDSEIQDNKLKVRFDMNDDDVKIINKRELTLCLNEILIAGESKVRIASNLDLLTRSALGEVVLFGMPGNGQTTIRKDHYRMPSENDLPESFYPYLKR